MSGLGSQRPLHLVHRLSALPREIVDKIFDGLSLFKVLQLATWADPTMAAYILEHDHYGRVFLSAEQLERAASRFMSWCQVKRASGWRDDRRRFAVNPTSSLFAGVTYVAVMDDMMTDIIKGCLRGSQYAQISSQFPLEPAQFRLDEKNLRQYLQRLWTVQESIKELESRQLNTLGDLMETYPQMLRWAHDPRGDASTTPPEHIIKGLRACAKKVFNTQYMRFRKPVYCRFAFRNGIVPIVPRDWCLQLLLRADLPSELLDVEASQRMGVDEVTDNLKHTALPPTGKQLPGVSKKVQASTSHPPEAPKTTDSLPLNVINDLRTVFRGLIHRYVGRAHTVDGTPIPRIFAVDRIPKSKELLWRSFAARGQILYHDPPAFFVPLRSEFNQRGENMLMKHDKLRIQQRVEGKQFPGLLPYPQQEVEWLHAFLRSVAYLQTLQMPDRTLQA